MSDRAPFARTPWRGVVACTIAGFACVAIAHAAEGDRSPDSIAVTVPVVEVTALRGRDALRDIPASSYVIDRAALARIGAGRVTTVLSRLPGFHAYRQTGSGEPSVIDPRGFTANGESSYLKLLVNGQDMRDVENGNVDWDWLAADDLERIEVIEGSGAWLYGDGSEGGIVNLVRPGATAEGVRSDCAARVGSHGLVTGSLVLGAHSGAADAGLRGSLRRADGWRDRSEEEAYGGGFDFESRWSPVLRTGIDIAVLDTRREDPGSLTREELRVNREQAETQTDYAHSRRVIVGGRMIRATERAGEFRLAPFVRYEETDQIRTIFFTPKSHPTDALTTGGELTWRRAFARGERAVVLDAGVELEHSRLESRYEAMGTGLFPRGQQENRRVARRLSGAVHAGGRIELDERTTARIGVRGDVIRIGPVEQYTNLLVNMGGGVTFFVERPDSDITSRTLRSVSPFVALSRRIGSAGTVYANFTTGFRVPTLNQLYDSRLIFNPFTNSDILLSNTRLDPQRSVGFEVGGRRDGTDGSWAMLSAYSVRVRDEIDFDLGTFSYANIGKSWHRGIQLGVSQALAGNLALIANGAWMPTTIRGGENDGNQINAVPEGTAYGALAWSPDPRGSLEAGVRYTGRQFLDKANQHALADFATAEVSASARIARLRSTLRVANLLDREYEDSGFIGAIGEERFLPAAGRTLSLALTFD